MIVGGHNGAGSHRGAPGLTLTKMSPVMFSFERAFFQACAILFRRKARSLGGDRDVHEARNDTWWFADNRNRSEIQP
jgi:hypothetical protein